LRQERRDRVAKLSLRFDTESAMVFTGYSDDLIYTPSLHPWSIYRFDPELEHLDRLIEMAKENDVPVLNAMQLYEEYRLDA
jgi:hypothetical protein